MTTRLAYLGLCISLFFIVMAVPSAMGQMDSDLSTDNLRKAAEQGNSDAMFFLGLKYARDVKDEDEAIKWYRKATAKGLSNNVRGNSNACTELKFNPEYFEGKPALRAALMLLC